MKNKCNNQAIKLVAIIILAVTLTACGEDDAPITPFSRVANAQPVAGSVIQYARTEDISNYGIDIAANGAVTFTNLIAAEDNFTLDAANNTGTELDATITTTARVYTETILSNQNIVSARTISFTDTANSSEYITAGVWIEDYSANSTLGDVGIFVDGSQEFTNIAQLTGTKTYSGIANGYYHDTDFTDNAPIIFASGSVTITVDFGTDSEAGMITDVAIINLTAESPSDPNYAVRAGFEINGQAADIANEASGFTTGDTIATADDGSEYSGKWGSQFYSTDAGSPKYIAGTFGATGTNSVSKYGTFIGTFIVR